MLKYDKREAKHVIVDIKGRLTSTGNNTCKILFLSRSLGGEYCGEPFTNYVHCVCDDPFHIIIYYIVSRFVHVVESVLALSAIYKILLHTSRHTEKALYSRKGVSKEEGM